jgi:hypothetical protein
MHSLTEEVWKLSPPMGVFDETVVCNLFPDKTAGARKALVHRAVSSGEVLRLKPGLYCLPEPWRRDSLHPFALASVLLSPSHVSLETALWHHGLIPEAVREVASVTPLRARTFQTPVGSFTYRTVPTRDARAGVRATEVARNIWAFIATPLRAVADLVYLRRGVNYEKDGLAFLTDSLRIELEDLQPVHDADVDEIASSVKNKRTVAYLHGLQRELG